MRSEIRRGRDVRGNGLGLNQTTQTLLQLPIPLRQALSGGDVNMLEAGQHWQQIQQTYGNYGDSSAVAKYVAATSSTNAPSLSGITPVIFSVMTGFTQSETSTAW